MLISLDQYEKIIREYIEEDATKDQAHDINHILRVVKSSKKLAEQENANMNVVIPAAYLHDCVTVPKNHPDRNISSVLSADKAIDFLQSIDYPQEYFNSIHHAISAHSFSANIETKTLEAKIVQDADRLDALGAIGIARCLAVGFNMGASLYSTNDPFCKNRQTDDLNYSIDHFYAKLLKLQNTMKTDSARLEAQRRSKFMKDFLNQLENEIV
jgi:uncharacterized protein